jgi:hypothetical protein
MCAIRNRASGLLEYDRKTGRSDKFEDPDDENERPPFEDHGLIHGILQPK